MKLKQKEQKPLNNNLADFPENTLGVIEEWGLEKQYIGTLVVREKDSLYELSGIIKHGFDTEKKWYPFPLAMYHLDNFRIRVLEKGEEITVIV
jgi:hypothetical protein